jgi:hypothetical protein
MFYENPNRNRHSTSINQGGIMLAFLGGVLSYLIKNLAIIIGVLEAIMKVAAGIVSMTPTKKDDAVYATVDKYFSIIKKWLYTISDKLAGKEANIPN